MNVDQVRNEAADDFLSLLKEWAKLCQYFSLYGKVSEQSLNLMCKEEEEEEEKEEVEDDDDSNVPDVEFEVERLLAVCYGDPNKKKKPGMYFKVLMFDVIFFFVVSLDVGCIVSSSLWKFY